MKISGFKQEKVLGEGSYGKVYKTRRLNDNKIYALKVVDLNKLSYREIQDAVNEIRLMASITSPFIISFYEAMAAEDQKRLCIVTEYAKLGDLSHLIERRKLRNRPLQEELIWQFLLEILEGLRILHSCGVVHRDLKSANILLSAPDLVKIGDLGIATVLHNRKASYSKEMAKTQIGTPLYLAPEVWQNRPYDQKCDMWSLGVVLYEMLTFSFPFLGRTQNDLQRRICAGAYQLPKYTERLYSRELISIMRRLLMVNPNERPSVDDLFNMQSIKVHMDLLNPFLQTELFRCSSMNDISFECGHAKLLSTIRVPRANYDRYGRRNLNFEGIQLPSEKYDKRPPVIMPIEERIQMKKDAPIPSSVNIATLSTPDLTLIADHDWWVPNKEIKSSFSEFQIDPDAIELQQQPIQPDENQLRNANFFHNENNERPSPRKQEDNLFIHQNQQPRNDQFNNIEEKEGFNLNPNIRPSPRKQYKQEDNFFIHQNQQPRNDQFNNIEEKEGFNLNPNIRPSPRKLYKQEENEIDQTPQIQHPIVQPPKVSPRMIPPRFRYLYKPCLNKQYQDPRWQRKQPSIKQPIKPPFNNHVNYNNIFYQHQRDVPWWYGQELQKQPKEQLPRRCGAFFANPRFKRN